MGGFNFQALLCSLAAIFLIHVLDLSSTEASVGFSVDLISRDSPVSPLYDPSQTRLERLQNAFRRSISRANRFRLAAFFPDAIQSGVIGNSGSYLMNVSLGTPPVPILAIADTGSDLTWTQCKPCTDCYNQEAPLFDPTASSSYKDLSCESQYCEDLSQKNCSSEGNCIYSYSYGDLSYTMGNLASETLTFASTSGGSVSFKEHVFGCGHDNGGSFGKEGSGLVGLGGGSLSLISQLSSTINGQFSYCLVPQSGDSSVSSKMNFGSNGVVSGSGVVSTPLIKGDPETFYYLSLEAMTVGSRRLAYKGLPFTEPAADFTEANIIIDSGTTLTLISQDFYSELESSIREAIGQDPVSDPTGFLNLCFSYTDSISFPIITAHFKGADLELQPINTFIRVTDDVICLSIVPTDSLAIFGNLAQMNFLVGYDLKSKKVSFKPTDCTKN